jgi:hypothetical protein
MCAVEKIQFVAEVAVPAIGREVEQKNRGRECEDYYVKKPAALRVGIDSAILMRARAISTPPEL